MTHLNRTELRTMYPKNVTLDNVRIILGISKRKAAWLLQNGHIECTLTDKKTRRYIITIDAIFDYMDKVIRCDESVIIPTGLFNAHQSQKSLRMHEVGILFKEKIEPNIDDFKAWLDDEWYSVEEMLTVEKVAEITGYIKSSVQGWMNTSRLKSAWTQNKQITTKEWLIDFYLQYGFDIHIMCDKHINMIKEYCK